MKEIVWARVQLEPPESQVHTLAEMRLELRQKKQQAAVADIGRC